MPTTPEARRAYTRKISEKRQAKLAKTNAERMEFVQWKKFFGLGKLDTKDPDSLRRKDYIRWFIRLELQQLHYLFRVAPKLLNGIPVAPYQPQPKLRRPKTVVQDGDGGTIAEL